MCSRLATLGRPGGVGVGRCPLPRCLTALADYFSQLDALVYRFGGQRIVGGRDLYSIGLFGSRRILLFTYTPFAAICSVPLTLLTPMWLQTLSLASVPALLGDAVRRSLEALHTGAASRMWPLAALLIGLCLWLEPVRYSAQWGQINVLLLAVVIADVLSSPAHKWAGVGVGLVAGIKLTPLIFLIYLGLIGRLRAALLASAAFAATVVVSFVVAPQDSQSYWLQRYFAEPARIAPDPAVSSSLRGLFLRLHYPAGVATAAAVLLYGSRAGGCDTGVPSRPAGARRRDRGLDRPGGITVQLEPPLGVVRRAAGTPRLPRLRRRFTSRALVDVATVGAVGRVADRLDR